jgi:hypothetical protein
MLDTSASSVSTDLPVMTIGFLPARRNHRVNRSTRTSGPRPILPLPCYALFDQCEASGLRGSLSARMARS